MKKLFLALALTGMVGAATAGTLRQDDKTKKETVTTTKDTKTPHCEKETKGSNCCKDKKATSKGNCCKEKKTDDKKTNETK
jgi:hypothetical protein